MITAPLFWLALAAALLLMVLVGVDIDGLLLVGALASLLLASLTGLIPLPALLQGLSFLLLLGAGYGVLRRWSQAQRDRSLLTSERAELAEVITPFDAQGEGRVLWQGQSWAALNLEPHQIVGSGSKVTVLGRDGTRLQVIPLNSNK